MVNKEGAELVGIFAVPHAPLVARDWARLPEGVKTRLGEDYHEMGRRITACKPDVLIIVAPDHWTNFFINNLPTVLIGLGEEHDPPPEPFLRDFRPALRGAPTFARHLVDTALADGFEPSLSYRMALDHGFCLPLMKMELAHLPPIVPMVLNSLEPPMPSVARCAAWGRLLLSAIKTSPEQLRVAILASGGLSHSIGEATMGDIDIPFDEECMRLLAGSDDAALFRYLDQNMDAAGNGSHEIRNWLVAHGAADGGKFELVDYYAVPEVYVGCGFASWAV